MNGTGKFARRVVAILAVVGSAVAVLVIQPAASGSESTDAELLTAWAGATGVPLEAAATGIVQEHEFIQAADKITEALGEGNVDIWMTRDEAGAATHHVRVANDANIQKAKAALALVPSTIAAESYKFEKSDWLLADVTATVDKAAPQLVEEVSSIQGMYADIATGEVVVDVAADPDKAQIDALKRSFEPQGVAFRVHVLGEKLSDTASIRGGLRMTSCTTGFGVASRNTESVLGYYTAAHCGTSQSWYAAGSSTAISSTYYSQNYGLNSDIQVRTIPSGHTIAKDVWISGSTYKAIYGTATSVAGTIACLKGNTTGYHCAGITSTSYKPTWAGACPGGTCNSVFVSHPTTTIGGDSGGSSFSSSGYALGIHKGGGTNLSVYSKISYAPTGWTVNP